MNDSLGNWVRIDLLGAGETVDRVGMKQCGMEVPVHDTHTSAPLYPTPLPLLVWSWHPEALLWPFWMWGCGGDTHSMAASCMLLPDLLVSYSKLLGR